ncbi:MAG: SLBB domain-containing protein [Panacagrimonas sp.]
MRQLASMVAIGMGALVFAPAADAQSPDAPVGTPDVPRATGGTPNQLPVAPPANLNSSTLTLAPGDVITMTVFNRPELTTTVYVSDKGTIEVPLAGSVPVLGLTPSAASERVATAYREGDYLIDPQVNIVLAAFRSQQISVLGEVARPGRFPMDTRTSVLDALAQAGGVTQLGAEKAYILRRSGGGVDRFEIDLSDLLTLGSGQIVELRAGDTVVVPRAELFYIYGEVQRPNSYALRQKRMSVIEGISVAGGLTPRGSSRRIEIKRKTKDGKLITLDAEPDDAIQADDVINVRERIF